MKLYRTEILPVSDDVSPLQNSNFRETSRCEAPHFAHRPFAHHHRQPVTIAEVLLCNCAPMFYQELLVDVVRLVSSVTVEPPRSRVYTHNEGLSPFHGDGHC
jgi:hypothetical protein